MEQTLPKESQKNPITLDDYCKLPINTIRISVVKFTPEKGGNPTTYDINMFLELTENIQIMVSKRYSEFKILYETLKGKYKNISLPEFPSKFQLINKEEDRIKHFDSLLRTILNLAKNNLEDTKNFLKILYEFIVDDPKKEVIQGLKSQDLYYNNSMKYKPNDTRKSSNLTLPAIPNDYIVGNSNDYNSNKTHNASTIQERDTYCYIESSNYYHWQNVYIKIGKEQFFKGYIKIHNQFIWVYKTMTLANFYLAIPLYKIQYDMYRRNLRTNDERYIEKKDLFNLNNQNYYLEDFNSEIRVKLYHPFDMFDLQFRFSSSTSLSNMTGFINVIELFHQSGKYESIYMNPIDMTNLNIYGKIYIEIISVTIPDYEGQALVKVNLDPYQMKTKLTMAMSSFAINQIFLLPLHNRFRKLRFEVFKANSKSIKKVNEDKIGDFTLEMPQLLNDFFVPTKPIELIMKNEDKSYNKNIVLSFKIIDYSNLTSLIVKNRNKHVLEDMILNDSEDDLINIKTLFKRIKKMFMMLQDYQAFYKNAFRFKYPIFSGLIMFFSIIFFLFCDTKYLITHIIFLVVLISFSYSKLYNVSLRPLFNKYVFYYKNPYDQESCYIRTIDDKKNEEVKKQNYLIEKEESTIFTTLMEVKNYKEYLQTYNDILFSFTNIVSTFEKMKNLFLWTDPLLSFYFIIVMLFLMLIVFQLEFRYVMLLVVVKKFITGINFYKRKRDNNLEVGRILLEHCMGLWKKEIKKKETKLKFQSDENGDFRTMKIFDDKYKLLIKEEFEKHAELLVKEEYFNQVETLGDIQMELGKCKSLLKIKNTSHLSHFTANNPLIRKTPIEPEDVFYYFIQNVKSDYYISRYSLGENEDGKENEDRFMSCSYENYIEDNVEEKDKERERDKDKNKEREEREKERMTKMKEGDKKDKKD